MKIHYFQRFDLTQVMGVSELPDTSVLAEKLKSITWE